MMSSLPTARVAPARPFLRTGVDYAGPILIRTGKGRGHKSHKGFIIVFICFATKAVHLEAASDYSTDAFLAAFRRFTSRRSLCEEVYSDCGINFVGADRELRLLFQASSSDGRRIAHLAASDGIWWKFNPSAAPHFGGLWEAAVKSIKHHLRRVLGDTTFTFEEMSTFLAQVEACLNSRPLQALSDDHDDITALTPGHFLIGAPLLAVPEPSLTDSNISLLPRWKLLQRMRDHFWERWSREYINSLASRPKWLKDSAKSYRRRSMSGAVGHNTADPMATRPDHQAASWGRRRDTCGHHTHRIFGAHPATDEDHPPARSRHRSINAPGLVSERNIEFFLYTYIYIQLVR
ncbi:uncharacterized protein LOC112638750 [Camponotus floridanus]|uniref:uncharacterized protein LOC112638750 n=1 Tax=Camponotus floridanus TaxID=104421 RepID=UPI000DC67E17|nr:uncharacterized protein LOC112638750 [Camponotus floridanus]